MRRAFALFLFLAILPAFTLSLSVSTDKPGYAKGETVYISGNATPRELVSIELSYGPILLYSDRLLAPNGTFLAAYPISGSDPKGDWSVLASSRSGSASAKIAVNPTREGAYYLVRFTSPTFEGVEYARTDSIPVSVSVFDSGKPVLGASLFAWAGGKPFPLSETSPGVYRGDYWIPPGSKTGVMEIYAVAEKKAGGISFGGEKSTTVNVKPVPIRIEFISPSADTYKVGETVQVRVRLAYSTGRLVAEPSLIVNANDITLPLLREGEFYSGEYTTGENDAGVLKLIAEAEDAGGNSGSAYRNVNIRTSTLSDYYWQAILGTLAVLAIVVFVIKIYLERSSLRQMEKKKEELIALEKGLQEEYLKKKSIDRESYERRMSNYESKLSELNDKISRSRKGKK